MIRPQAWLVALVLLTLTPVLAAGSHLKEQPKKHKVVYHLTEAGVDTFVTASIDTEVKAKLDRLQVQGVIFGACGNTMKNFNLTLEQLPQGARYLPQGGVVRIMELIEQGYVYIRP
jgi:intracellular sulfur oxidation DsrE/DsrF family protein